MGGWARRRGLRGEGIGARGKGEGLGGGRCTKWDDVIIFPANQAHLRRGSHRN